MEPRSHYDNLRDIESAVLKFLGRPAAITSRRAVVTH
jgi:hypothetical protein